MKTEINNKKNSTWRNGPYPTRTGPLTNLRRTVLPGGAHRSVGLCACRWLDLEKLPSGPECQNRPNPAWTQTESTGSLLSRVCFGDGLDSPGAVGTLRARSTDPRPLHHLRSRSSLSCRPNPPLLCAAGQGIPSFLALIPISAPLRVR
jgi:hypothetical protein